MTGTWRPLTFAAAIIVTMAAAATAQTVIVAKTPPGTAVELGVNAKAVGTATSDNQGVATFPLNTLEKAGPKVTGKTEMDVRVFVDVCDKSRRVWLTETGWQPPAVDAGCVRRELFGLFSLQRNTSLVVDAAEQNQAVWIRQGPVPAHWLDPNAQPETTGGFLFPLPTGLSLFGGAGAGLYGNIGAVACGSGTECTTQETKFAIRAGADFWINRFMAATGSYLRPVEMKATGSGSGFRFTTTLLANVATFGGKIALPARRARVYGEGGGVYQRSNLQTTQSINPIVITGDDGDVVVSPGGTQVFNMQTAGWSWYAGGGVEIWVKKTWAVFGEAGRVSLQGSPRAGGEGHLDDSLIYAIGGVRLHVGR
jgi:hypothetical protein